MTNNLVKFFQTSPSANTGDVLDLNTWNNNVGQWGKLGYFAPLVTANQQRILLTFSNSILNATNTIVTWSSATIPNTNMWTSGTYIDIPVTGFYFISFQMAVPGSTAGLRNATLMINDAAVFANQYMDAAVNTNVQSQFAPKLSAGDRIQMRITQNSTATRTVTGSIYVQKLSELED